MDIPSPGSLCPSPVLWGGGEEMNCIDMQGVETLAVASESSFAEVHKFTVGRACTCLFFLAFLTMFNISFDHYHYQLYNYH